MMDMTNPWNATRQYFDEVDSTLKTELTKKWMKMSPTLEMKCQSFVRLRETLKNSINLFLEEEDNILIKHKISKLRDEINNLWSLLWYTENEKMSFKEYSVDIYSEDVMHKHENYKKHLEALYNSNRELFSMLAKFETTQNHVKDLEAEKSDPARLFNNRGAQLLKSEKEIKEGKKELIKLEESIVQLSLQHNQKYGQPLLIHGEEIIVWLKRKKSENHVTKSAVKTRVRPWHSMISGATNGQDSSAKKKKKLDL